MIVSASRRTDIPALYAPWFFHRLSEGFVWVRNPFNPHQVSRIPLSPDEVDAFVFWTKNAAPMLAQLDALRPYPFYFSSPLPPTARTWNLVCPPNAPSSCPLFCGEPAHRPGARDLALRSYSFFIPLHARFPCAQLCGACQSTSGIHVSLRFQLF